LSCKDKKINKIYNILITVVIILIIAVGATIFTGKDADVSTSPKETLKADQTKQSDTNQKADKNQESDKNQQSDEGQKSDEDKEETPTDESLLINLVYPINHLQISRIYRPAVFLNSKINNNKSILRLFKRKIEAGIERWSGQHPKQLMRMD